MSGTFKSELQAQLKAQRSFGQKGDHWDNYAVANCGLNQDLGRYQDSDNFDYGLDDTTRDQSWSRLSEQILRVDKWSVCRG